MKIITAGLCLAVVSLSAASAGATDRAAIEIEGSYLLLQDDDHQRIVSFDSGGNVVLSSDLETSIGFATGLGAWEQTGPGEVTARIVNFNFSLEDGQPMGVAIAVYELTFSDEVSGQYQKVSGSFAGGQYERGQNPLTPTKEPYRQFGASFKGTRITAE